MIIGSSRSIDAAKIGKAEFFAPDDVIEPLS